MPPRPGDRVQGLTTPGRAWGSSSSRRLGPCLPHPWASDDPRLHSRHSSRVLQGEGRRPDDFRSSAACKLGVILRGYEYLRRESGDGALLLGNQMFSQNRIDRDKDWRIQRRTAYCLHQPSVRGDPTVWWGGSRVCLYPSLSQSCSVTYLRGSRTQLPVGGLYPSLLIHSLLGQDEEVCVLGRPFRSPPTHDPKQTPHWNQQAV